ncbi:hypothetical protein L1887_56619 [Cichorium endivia]|nr:hypothetical protein L1887_62717 [Cichorium endivia]KAI3476357.1 hypothetical protein L1887_62071 [Cichorium endivia]KAI3476562.1 hypothetical protein L1887_61866 [Cichorium endivia]KAI3480276.1 hypothetical protein L1887_57576 [Cichorium endivia]KAI3481106.1 hypothetical protein L1887_56619 [Cichorium endivia]
MTELSLPCSYKKESLLRIESTHIEFSKDLNRCLPSNIVHPVDGLYYTKARSGLILAYSYEGRKVSRSEEAAPLTAPYRVLGLVFQRRTITKGKQPPDIDLPATSNSHSPSADSDTESSLLERGAEALPLTQGAFHHFD